jgi:hypothetical protein
VRRHGIKEATNGPAHLLFDDVVFWIQCSGDRSPTQFANIHEGLWVTDAQGAHVLQPMMVLSQAACKGSIKYVVTVDLHVTVQQRSEKHLEAFASQASALHIAAQNQL